MNVEKIRSLAAYIRDNDHPFNMRRWDLCIVGHAAMLWPDEVQNFYDESGVRRVLGVDAVTMNGLVFGGSTDTLSSLTRLQASKCLYNLADTGVVDWESFKSN